jgi:hypothetical protein
MFVAIHGSEGGAYMNVDAGERVACAVRRS